MYPSGNAAPHCQGPSALDHKRHHGADVQWCPVARVCTCDREGDTANCVFMIMSGAVELIQHLDTPPPVDDALDDVDHSFR